MPRILLPLLSLLIAADSSLALSRASLLFLTIPPSPQLNGTAGALTSTAITDPLTVIINPGTLGLAAQSERAAAALYPQRAEWHPGFNLSDLQYSARALALGSTGTERIGGQKSPIYAGFAYSEVWLDLGETQRRGPNNEPLSTHRSWERMRGITLAGSFVRPVRVGFGVSFKHVVSHLGVAEADVPGDGEARVFANDIGIVASQQMALRTASEFAPFVTPTIGYALTNFGGRVRYFDDIEGDPLPRTARISFALGGGLLWKDAEAGDWQIVSAEYAVQGEDELITVDNSEGDFHYQGPVGDIKIFSDLLFGNSNDRIDKQRGWQISVGDMVFVRGGSFEDVGDNWVYRTSGLGLRLYGMLRTAETLVPPLRGYRGWSYVARHIDLTYSESEWEQSHANLGGPSVIDGTTFRQISIILR